MPAGIVSPFGALGDYNGSSEQVFLDEYPVLMVHTSPFIMAYIPDLSTLLAVILGFRVLGFLP